MLDIFDPIEPFNSFKLKVSNLHSIYVEEVGNKNGLPIIFVHGGPGGGLDEKYRRYFDPKIFRVILFDQRGCGKSEPWGEIRENTTFDLVADIEQIREKLNISNWHVFGGSWGSTLALTYAISHPSRVLSLTLRGIFLLRKSEIDWFYQDGAGRFYPEEWEKYLAPIPPAERGDMVKAYHQRLNSSDQNILQQAACAWSAWEGATSKLIKQNQMVERFSDNQFAIPFARIENHYFYHQGFFSEDNWILKNINKITNIPGTIVQGRYDMPCPPYSAYELHKAWPKAKFMMIEAAGHSLSEQGITEAILKAVREIYDRKS